MGALIEQARKALVPRVSQREAARRAGMSEGRWRDAVHGQKSVATGVTVPVNMPDDTLIRMGRAVGVEREVRDALGRPQDEWVLYEPERGGPTSALATRELAEKLARLDDRGRAFIEEAVDLALERQQRSASE